ncbi:MAG: winged helix-turn-helix domain-containing protein [Colwellia sp.]|nr:winged helix-turn-helix domain-containing protein [Colwellia sp.]
MRYKIKEFDFDSDSLVLMKNGEPIAIRHNEAKVLALLLENLDTVLSKENILSAVWQDKVVSEQAVFQNISHLRVLFGNHAIKTFSKRGYQWQLKVATQEETLSFTESPLTAEPAEKTIVRAKSALLGNWPYVLLMSMFVFIFAVINWPNPSTGEGGLPIIKLAYIPFVDQQATTTLTLDDNNNFDFSELTDLDSATFLTSAELEYPNLSEQHPFVLAGILRSHQQKVYLDFVLKGPYADWKGQLHADSTQALVQQLEQHLRQPFIYQFLSSPQSPEFKKSSLSIAHQQSPQDSIILGQLIKAYIETTELDKAMVLAEKLATNANAQKDWQQLGNALLYQSTILTRKELYELSEKKLALAIKSFEHINDLPRQADAWNAQSWLDHQYDDYSAVKASLLKSAQLAFDAGDQLRELHALTYLSVLAHKHKQENDKYGYLRQAENKMTAYKLPIYHFAKVPFHYAIFAKTPLGKEPHLKQVLAFTQLTPDHWVAQSSREQLVVQYLKQERLAEAQTLVESVKTDNARNSYLKTLLAKAKGENESFIRHAKRTFEQAQLAGRHTLSLDVALLLRSTPNIEVNYDFYSLYIDENASAYWREANEVKLLALNL